MLGWASEQAVMAHGAWQREKAAAFSERAFRWLEK